MSDLSLLLTGAAFVYVVVAVGWFFVAFRGWLRAYRSHYAPASERTIGARMTLVAPLWPLFMLFVAWQLAAERWHPAGVGRMIGDFALDVKGRDDDE